MNLLESNAQKLGSFDCRSPLNVSSTSVNKTYNGMKRMQARGADKGPRSLDAAHHTPQIRHTMDPHKDHHYQEFMQLSNQDTLYNTVKQNWVTCFRLNLNLLSSRDGCGSGASRWTCDTFHPPPLPLSSCLVMLSSLDCQLSDRGKTPSLTQMCFWKPYGTLLTKPQWHANVRAPRSNFQSSASVR